MMINLFSAFLLKWTLLFVCCITHNWVINDGIDEFIIPEYAWVANINHDTTTSGQASEHTQMVNFRQGIANQMWEDRENYMNHSNV
jgi:hypothetical protein